MATIVLTKGYSAEVDEADMPALSKHMWQAQVTETGVYAKRNISAGGKQRVVFMHRELLSLSDYRRVPDPPPPGTRGAAQRMRFVQDSAACGKVVDHINGNTLDNRRANLRVATRSVNATNTWKHREQAMMREIERLTALSTDPAHASTHALTRNDARA